MPLISFLNYSLGSDKTMPSSGMKNLPEWYKRMPRYFKNTNGSEITDSTVKGCMPFFDAMSAGYTINTPCDIEFYIEDGVPNFRVFDDAHSALIGTRDPIDQFFHPIECYDKHFHWYPNWAVSLEKGYSALYINPINRYDLPFVTTNGIIDNDMVDVRGFIPFFLKKGFEKVFIPQGTPFVQVIPFKREDWKSEYIELSEEDINIKNDFAVRKYRTVKNSGYKKIDWQRKSFN